MRVLFFLAFFGLSACAQFPQIGGAADPAPDAPTLDGPPPPPPSARTVEQFDTTTEEERIAATNPSSGGARLGETVASLGDATMPGFWVQTSLVSEVQQGRVVNPVNGRSVAVELRPIEGGSTRVSLAAMRLLDAPLTDLVTLELFRS
ncbi:MAG: D-galactarate dehydratase [Pseudomonadota bacterium]